MTHEDTEVVQPAPDAPLVEWALYYASIGIPVFPLSPRRKEPLISKKKGGGGVDDATVELADIRGWWKAAPNANIGAATGYKFDALDVDEDGEETLMEHDPLRVATEVRCPGGGSHIYFEPSLVPLKNGVKFAPGLDFRTRGGYVILPPSYVVVDPKPESPSELKRRGYEGPYSWKQPLNGHLPPVPSWIVQAIRRSADESTEQSRTKLQEALTGNLKDGEKHSEIIKSIFKLRKQGLDIDVVKGVVRTMIEAIPEGRLGESRDDTLRKYLKEVEDCFAKHAPGPTVDKVHVDPVTGEVRKYKTTDLGNTERLLASFDGDLKYVSAWKRFLTWDGSRFLVDEKGEAPVMDRAKKIVRALWTEVADMPDGTKEDRDAKKAFVNFIASSESRTKLEAVLGLAKKDIHVSIATDELDVDPWLMNVLNGTVNLRSGEFRAHDRSDLMTKLVSIPYDPDAKCPKWTEFVMSIFGGDRELARFLHRAVGYSLTGDIREHVLFFLYGSGSNGKTTLVDTLMNLVGDYGKRLGAESLMVTRYTNQGGPTPEIAKLKGARLVAVSETSDSGRLDESRVKDLTGGDRITACMKYGDPFEFDPTHKLWMSGNHMPEIKGTDTGIWRRIKVIPFHQTFSDDPPDEAHRKDRSLSYTLRGELPGILNWAIRGCQEWQSKGLNPPSVVEDAVSAYRESQDVLGDFLKQCTEQGEHQHVKGSALYSAYKSWCVENSISPSSSRRFHPEMESRGFKRSEYSGLEYYRKIGLVSPSESGTLPYKDE